MVLHTDELHVSHSLKKKLRKTAREMGQSGALEVHFDRNFEGVMRGCAQPREASSGTWISEDIVAGYCGLHAAGFAHSAELWRDDQLLAGAYGVSIGSMFYGESMFTHIADGSKIAFIYLVHFLRQNGVRMIDCQQETSHLASLGARPIPRSDFLRHLRLAIEDPQITEWKPIALFGTDPKNFCP
jgi:leucyl/phenylalanyl-tRNA--protein transferase